MANLSVDDIDNLRRHGDKTWEEYKEMMKGAFKWDPARLMKDVATGVRYRDGRLKELEHLPGK